MGRVAEINPPLPESKGSLLRQGQALWGRTFCYVTGRKGSEARMMLNWGQLCILGIFKSFLRSWSQNAIAYFENLLGFPMFWNDAVIFDAVQLK